MERVSKADLSLLGGRESSRADLGLLSQPRSREQQPRKSPLRDSSITDKASNLQQKAKDAEVARPFLDVVKNQLVTAKNKNRSKSTPKPKSPLVGRSSTIPRRNTASRPQPSSPAFTLLSKSSEGLKASTFPLVVQPPTGTPSESASGSTRTRQNSPLSPKKKADVARFRDGGACRRCVLLKQGCDKGNPCRNCAKRDEPCEEAICQRCAEQDLGCNKRTPCERCTKARVVCEYKERSRTPPESQRSGTFPWSHLLEQRRPQLESESIDPELISAMNSQEWDTMSEYSRGPWSSSHYAPSINDAPERDSQQEHAETMYMHYTISQDCSGNSDSLISERLAALGARDREPAFATHSLGAAIPFVESLPDRDPRDDSLQYFPIETRGLTDYFVPASGISREVIQAEICRYVGNDATVRPFTHKNGRSGYLVRGSSAVTTGVVESLKKDTAAWRQEREQRRQRVRVPFRT